MMVTVNSACAEHNCQMSAGHPFSHASSVIALSVGITAVMSAFSVLLLSVRRLIKDKITIYRNVLMVRYNESRII